MKGLPIIAGVALAVLVPVAGLADPGTHAHPHLVAAMRPRLDLPPALGLVITLAVWAAIVAGAEALARRQRARV